MRRLGTIIVATAFLVVAFGATASLAGAAPYWGIKARVAPQNPVPGDTAELYIQPRNYGDSNPDESTITIRDELPPGVTVASFPDASPFGWQCTGEGTGTVECTMEGIFGFFFNPPRGPEPVENGFGMRIVVDLDVDPGASGTHMNKVEMLGGSAPNTAVDEDPWTLSSTPAGFGYADGSFEADVFDADRPLGQPVRQAGSHPFEMRVDFDFSLTKAEREGTLYSYPEGVVRTVESTLPKGLVGNPEATPKCAGNDFLASPGGLSSITGCAANTQVGYISLELSNGATNHGFGPFNAGAFSRVPVYNLEPPKGYPADFGFTVAGVVTGHIFPTLDPSHDYAIQALTPYISTFTPVRDVSFTMWGVPGDPAHDHLRGNPTDGKFGASFSAPVKPFLTLPTDCSTGDSFTQRSDSWQQPGIWAPSASSGPVDVTGCDDQRVRFKPQVALQPSSTVAGGPTGLDVHLEVPQREDTVTDPTDLYHQNGDVRSIATPPLKKAVVTLPEGMTISTSAAQGLGNCSPAQIGLGNNDPVTCPQNSQYGTLTLHTPILPKDAPMTGQIYIAKQNENPFGNFLSLYLVIQDPQRGLLVKIPGKVDLDPVTGQITTTFDDLPQFPVSDMELQFKGGVRAALVNPSTCGQKTIVASFYSWADPATPVTKQSSYEVTKKANGSPCVPDLGARPFAPGLSAGTVNPAAGRYSPFALRLQRSDDDQEISSLDVQMPPGLLAKISGIAKCPDAAIAAAEAPGRTGGEEAASPSCPAASQIGTTQVGSGVGQVLTYIPGKIYLAGPYKGAPLSLAVITPILAGPYDLGVIAVRSAVDVRPETAQVSVRTDPLPQIFKGIPVRIRDIRVDVDRAETMLNPTNCDPMEISAKVTGAGGDVQGSADDTAAELSSRFQAAACESLGFKPKLSLRLSGGTHRGDYPALTATLRARPGDANIAATAVTLPHSEFLAQEHIRTVCTRVQFAAEACPKASVYGRARAISPLFDQPLEGPVYLRSSNNPLPDLVARLNGEIDVVLSGRIDSVNQSIRNTFDVVPDAPVTKFTLKMQGGKKGLLVNSRNLCKGKPARADVRMAAQNGKVSRTRPMLATSCRRPATKR